MTKVEEVLGIDPDIQVEIAIKDFTKHDNAVRILKYLREHNPSYIKEIKAGTGLGRGAISRATQLMRRAGIIQMSDPYVGFPPIKYLCLNSEFPIDEILKRHHRHMGMILYKHVPLNKDITSEELMLNPHFRSDCRFHRITLEEGIEAVADNKRKITLATPKLGGYIFRRNEQ